jgi:very-short-patch-repair endonuclease
VVLTRSQLESRFLRMCRRFGIPKPGRNVGIEGKERDFVWRDARLVVEVDGHATHGTRFAFEDDRARDVALVRVGWRVVRFTHAQITFDAADVAAALRDLLGLGPFALA